MRPVEDGGVSGPRPVKVIPVRHPDFPGERHRPRRVALEVKVHPGRNDHLITFVAELHRGVGRSTPPLMQAVAATLAVPDPR